MHRLYRIRARHGWFDGQNHDMFKEDATASMVTRLCVISICIACWMLSCVMEFNSHPASSFCVTLTHQILNFLIKRKGFYKIKHCPRNMIKVSNEFQHLSHPPTRKIGSQLVLFWCKLIAELTCLCCRSWHATDMIVIKLHTKSLKHQLKLNTCEITVPGKSNFALRKYCYEYFNLSCNSFCLHPFSPSL